MMDINCLSWAGKGAIFRMGAESILLTEPSLSDTILLRYETIRTFHQNAQRSAKR